MRTVTNTLLCCMLSIATVSCTHSTEDWGLNTEYTEIQQKALQIFKGTWISEETQIKMDMLGQSIIVTQPSDTIIFTTQYTTPKIFYVFDFLQGKEIENFIACGTCEFRQSALFLGMSPSFYFYVTPQGDELLLYNSATETLFNSFELRVESEKRFYAGKSGTGTPIYFNRK